VPEAGAAGLARVPSRIVRQTSLVTVAYLAATAVLTVLWGRAVPWWPAIVTAHVALCVALLSLRRRRPLARPLSVALDWHPLALFPILYKEVQVLATAVGDWRLTAVVSAAEERLFGGQPSIYLSARLSVVALSEYLHFCYVAYVLIVPGVAAYWYLTKRRAAFHELMLLLAIAMFGSYLVFILWPVDSPFYRFDRLGPPLAGHVFFDLVHFVSSRGGARGGAFPSAHASGAVVLWLVAFRYQRRLAIVLTPMITGLIVATVYGRFHYVLDTIAGVGLAFAVVGVYRVHHGRPRIGMSVLTPH
jgi:membrane-associated phospholipid phosphatase